MAGYDSEAVVDNRERNRYELTVEGETAFLDYSRKADSIILVHTEVPPALRGHHVGDALVKAALERAAADGLKVVPVCSFVRKYMEKHPNGA